MIRLHARTRVVVALGSAQTLAWGSSYYLPAVLSDPIADDLHVSRTFVFATFSASLILMGLLGPAVGRRIDAQGGRGVLMGSSLVLAAGLVSLAAAQGEVSLALAWALLGVGMALGLYETAFATLAHLYGRAARTPITGITLMAGFASTIGWPVTAAMQQAWGWRTACLAWAAVHLLVTLPLYARGIPRTRHASDHAAEGDPALAEAHEPGHAPQRYAMPLLAFAFAGVAFVATAMAAHLPRLLQAAGASAGIAIAAASMVGPAQVFARVLEFGATHRYAPHPLISARIAAALHPIGAGFLAVLAATPFGSVAFALLHGAGNGLMTIARGTVPLALFGPVGYGARQGTIGGVARIVQAAAPLAFGVLLETAGWRGSLAVSAGLSMLALAALCLLKR